MLAIVNNNCILLPLALTSWTVSSSSARCWVFCVRRIFEFSSTGFWVVLGCSVQKRIMHWNYDMAWSQWDISPHFNTSWSTPFLLAYTTSRQQSDCMAAIVQKNWFLIYPLLGFKKSYYFVLDLARRQPSWTFSVGLHKMQMLQNNMREKYYRQLWGIGFVDFLYILTNRGNSQLLYFIVWLQSLSD